MNQPSARRRRTGYLFCLPGMAFLGLFLAYPLLYNVWTSVHDVDLANSSAGPSGSTDSTTTGPWPTTRASGTPCASP